MTPPCNASGRPLALRGLRVGKAETGGRFEVPGRGACPGCPMHSGNRWLLARHVPPPCRASCPKLAWSKSSDKHRRARSGGSQGTRDYLGSTVGARDARRGWVLGVRGTTVLSRLNFTLFLAIMKGSTFLWQLEHNKSGNVKAKLDGVSHQPAPLGVGFLYVSVGLVSRAPCARVLLFH